MASTSPPHVVIFPTMAQGHTVPLLDLSKALSRRGLTVTIITTPLNVPYISSQVSNHPQISLYILPFPRVPELPEGCENTSCLPSMDLVLTFLRATEKLKEPFEGFLREMSEAGHRPICVISDFFLIWTLDSCRSFGIPRLASHGMGVVPMLVCKEASFIVSKIMTMEESEPFFLQSVSFRITRADLPDSLQAGNADDPWLQFMLEVRKADAQSWGFIVNSFEELEGSYINMLESFLKEKESKAWCVGPLFLANQEEEDQSHPYIKWLDNQPDPNVVIYVSFGTQAHVSDAQMNEIAMGLEMAGHPFIWVVGSTEWSPPEGWEERVKERGVVARDWVEQRSILAHPSTGGFLSHCGWNSVLESLSNGVPILGWPMGAEQRLNAKYVAERLRAGFLVPQEIREGIKAVGREVICECVRELIDGRKGWKARKKARALEVKAREAVKKGGSSDRRLDQLIESLTHVNKDA